jgi:diaminohydroxyphosphoribosylaminopyrimidine deaminase / 5-amino-6-(5-phosphoribosylamino)uracil reductase
MVGSGTMTADNPSLTVRHLQGRQPLRVVVDSNARTPAGARVLDDTAPTLVAVAEDADAGRLGDHAVRVPRSDRGLDLQALLKVLEDRAGGLIDRIVAYIAPVAIGGGGKAALAGPGAPSIGDAKRFRLLEVIRIGPDVPAHRRAHPRLTGQGATTKPSARQGRAEKIPPHIPGLFPPWCDDPPHARQ